MTTTIGWCFTEDFGVRVYPEPERLHLPKDPSVTKRGHLSCPAVRSLVEGVYVIRAPYSLQVRYKELADAASFSAVYPFTSIAEERFQNIFRVEPTSIWRNRRTPIFQLPSPYLFVSDAPLAMTASHPFLADSTRLNWRLIPGQFDIHAWQRPLNWAVEWDIAAGDLIIKQGEPLYYVHFSHEDGSIVRSPRLKKIAFEGELKKRVQSMTGVTGMRRGTAKLIRDASFTRDQSFVDDTSQ